jgi:hypothetical protein
MRVRVHTLEFVVEHANGLVYGVARSGHQLRAALHRLFTRRAPPRPERPPHLQVRPMLLHHVQQQRLQHDAQSGSRTEVSFVR